MNIDWGNLPFGYFKTDYNVRCCFRDGEWGELEISSSEYVNLHMAATALHYGQGAFEGMKVFRGIDGKARLFRWEENGKRLQRSADGIMMAPVPLDLFHRAITTVTLLNRNYIPPFGTGASLYLRPVLFGSGPQVGVKPAREYMLIIFATPVGPYFKEGFKPVPIQLVRDYDRAAPHGTGHIKVGGNYAASLRPADRAHLEGFSSVLFLDSKENKYIDEAGPANFFGIKGNTYVTPASKTILPSIINMSLRQLAADMGLKVEQRLVPVKELEEFDEVGACGTAAVISPIGKIHDRETGKVYEYCKNGEVGCISERLYRRLTAIQYGEEPDPYGWTEVVEGA
ncbi:MAG TPA: branched-chain amino acid aminotransferase [Bacteroidales bacterium]|nr:branched-chain amino acid aminotransferase [Bacteroidales bacterium]HRZ21726.1 branched-chain amino acid aminotransferase [Bacteroidales bacterium]